MRAPQSGPERGLRLPRPSMTLRARLALTYGGLALALWAVFGFYLVSVARDIYLDRLASQLGQEALLIGEAVSSPVATGGQASEVDPLVKALGARVEARITIVGADGTVLGDSDAAPASMENHANRPEIRSALSDEAGVEERFSTTLNRDFLYVAVPIPEGAGAVARVALPLDDIDETVGRVQRDVALAAGVAALATAAVTGLVAARIAGPLDALRTQARAVADGRLDATVEPSGPREIADLGQAFNSMTRRIRHLALAQDQAQARLETMLANLTDGVVITDTAGTVLRLNAASARFFGTREREAVGRHFVVVSRDHSLAGLLERALDTGVPQWAVVEHGRGSRVLETSARPLVSSGEQLGLVVLRDVTELRRLEGIRRDFVANVSHELRTPLASIRMLVETLSDGAAEDPEVAQQFFSQAITEVDHLAAIVDDLLDLARLESGRIELSLESVNVGDLLTRAVERLRPQAERAGVHLHADLPPGLPEVDVDRLRIEQVMLNLVHNGIKFTPARGNITVTALADADEVTVTVRDTGVGFAEEDADRLFERFFKDDRSRGSVGTGLGLAISKHIVQAHGGQIWAVGSPGAGATFSFTLPRAARPTLLSTEELATTTR